MILCHDTERFAIRHSHVERKIPTLSELIELYEETASWVRESRVIGVALATHLTTDESETRERRSMRRATKPVCPLKMPFAFRRRALLDACERFREEFART